MTLVNENKWRAAATASTGKLIDLERDEERPAREAVLALVERAEPAASAARLQGGADARSNASWSVEREPTSSGSVYEETGSLLAVAQWLAETDLGPIREPSDESAILLHRRAPARRSSRFLGLNADDAEERNRPCAPS